MRDNKRTTADNKFRHHFDQLPKQKLADHFSVYMMHKFI